MAVALLQEQRKALLPVANAGHLLLGFLKYYGRVFDLEVGGGLAWLPPVQRWAAPVPRHPWHLLPALLMHTLVPLPASCFAC